MKINIIGISDIKPDFTSKELDLIHSGKFFAGGSRHRELVGGFLPKESHWHDIVVPLSSLYEAIIHSKDDWIVFASGDPLFYGIGITLQREFPDAEIVIHPNFNSLQLLAHRFKLPYGEFQTVTLTGRSFERFDQALIKGVERMGILTDRRNTPRSIAERMLQHGYSNYKMYYGERLGGEKEKIREMSLEEAVHFEFNHPNCFYLEKNNSAIPKKGIPESEFEPLDGRPNMITKMPIRMATLALMGLQSKKVFWDVGACTGSVSIEARLNHPHLRVKSFEIRNESRGIIERNTKKFQSPGIDVFIGDYLQADKSKIEKPDAVFVGGYGGKMNEVLDDIHTHLIDGGIIAFNSVSEKSKKGFTEWCIRNQYQNTQEMLVSVDEFNPITILIAHKGERK